MCGIYGVRTVGPSPDSDEALVRTMCDMLAHRGPDGTGLTRRDGVVLGHRRLAIIDLEAGRQPMATTDGEFVVSFNGEIYNYRSLREQLEGLGHRFQTKSDTEVLLHGWRQWGRDVLPRLHGMFAFAVHEKHMGRLTLVRDRLGIKPLYTATRPSDGAVLFASEIKALFAEPELRPRLDRDRVSEYFMFRTVAGEATLFDGVREVAPGSWITFAGSSTESGTYWSPRPSRPDGEPYDMPRIVDEGERLLKAAVEERLVSDVPLGTITSGGVDSSLVSALAARSMKGRLKTFCAGFEDPRYDERPFARLVAEHIGSEHHDIVVTPDELVREFERLTWAHDEPLTHPNSVPMHLIFRYAREQANTTVLLSGEGADEVFGGYDWYRVSQLRARLSRIPGISQLSRLVPGHRGRTLRRVLGEDYPLLANAITNPEELGPILASTGGWESVRRGLWDASGTEGTGRFAFDQATYLPPLLQRQDRMSMAVGLEGRVPFLDHRLVDWANALPPAVKLHGGQSKAVVMAIARRHLPTEIVDRRKVGFALPLAEWLRDGRRFGPYLDQILDPGSIVREVTTPGAVETLVREHREGTGDHTDLLWSMIALEVWRRVSWTAPAPDRPRPTATGSR